MFQFLFKYPSPVFTRGRFVLLSSWPAWLLPVSIVVAVCGLAWLIRSRLRDVAPNLRTWRAWLIWAMQSALVALILFLLWQPAVVVGELNSQQNIIAVIVDDSRSMSIADSDGKTRETAALAALGGGVLAGLQKRFQTRIYRLGSTLTPENSLQAIAPVESSTHIGNGLMQFAAETSDLPIGAVLLLTDGAENSAGLSGSSISLDALQALRNRRLPVHVIGFGKQERGHDVEIEDVSVASRAAANARVITTISLVQHGYAGQKATLIVRDGQLTLAERDVTLAPDGQIQTEPLYFPVGAAGAKSLTFSVQPLPGEENTLNNAVTRPILVSDAKRRILYVEGEPRWEYKFIRRAEDDDPTVQVASMVRTSENKIYRQGINNPSELADGFPVRPEDLFGYSGIIIGSVTADYFTPLQQELLREFVDRRGGGILFLGGRASLSDGGWAASSLNVLLPTFLPSGNHSFHRDPANVELTAEGIDSPITGLPTTRSKTRFSGRNSPISPITKIPELPSRALWCLLHDCRNRKMPLLITQRYGHGRTAILATGGTWRWQMSEPLGDPSHDLFWQQLLRWLVAESPSPVAASISSRQLMDEGRVQLSAEVRDPQFQPAPDAHVSVHIVGPGGINELVDLTPSQNTPGLYQTEWTAEKPGPYLAEVTAESAANQPLGSDVLTFQREDGVAENFHTEQNRPS